MSAPSFENEDIEQMVMNVAIACVALVFFLILPLIFHVLLLSYFLYFSMVSKESLHRNWLLFGCILVPLVSVYGFVLGLPWDLRSNLVSEWVQVAIRQDVLRLGTVISWLDLEWSSRQLDLWTGAIGWGSIFLAVVFAFGFSFFRPSFLKPGLWGIGKTLGAKCLFFLSPIFGRDGLFKEYSNSLAIVVGLFLLSLGFFAFGFVADSWVLRWGLFSLGVLATRSLYLCASASSTFQKDELQENAVHIGSDFEAELRPIFLSDKELEHHVHIVGESGFGKSVLISHLIEDRVKKGKGLLFIDLKADWDTIEHIQESCRLAGRGDDLQIFSCTDPSISHSFNVLQNGNANQLRDRIVGALEWSEQYYKNVASSVLLTLLRGLLESENQKKEISLQLVYEYLIDASKIYELTKGVKDGLLQKQLLELHRTIKDPKQKQSLTGLISQFESILFSDFGELMRHSSDGINFFDSIQKNKINYILLDSRRYGETSKVLGRMILEELKAVSSQIDHEIPKESRNPFLVIIDEFADLAQEEFIAFLDRARSSKIGIVVAHQEISDLRRISPEFSTRLMGNTATTVSFLQKIPESAELLAGIAGTQQTEKTTERVTRGLFGRSETGDASLRVSEEFLIHPNEFKRLRVGEAIVVRKYPFSEVSKLRVKPPNSLKVLVENTEIKQELTFTPVRGKKERRAYD